MAKLIILKYGKRKNKTVVVEYNRRSFVFCWSRYWNYWFFIQRFTYNISFRVHDKMHMKK